MNAEQTTSLKNGLKKLGLNAASDSGPADNLLRYINEIETWNPSHKLVAPGDDLVRRHILDSLSGLSAIRDFSPQRMADIGSGAGFPGIPLALWMPETSVCLVERMGRRAGFLRNVAAMLGMAHVAVLEKPVEKISEDEAGFNLVTFRAWSAIDGAVLDSMKKILAPDGIVAAYKGRRDVINEELDAIADRITEPRIIPLETFGGDEERNLVVFGLE